MYMKNISIFTLFVTLVLGALFLFSPVSVSLASAFSFRTGDSVIVSEGEVLDGSLFISGDSLTVDGVVNGDIYCAGKTVTIRGDIHGDVICAGQNLVITGIVDGNIRAAGQNLEIGAEVMRNVTIAGQNILIDKEAAIDGEAVSMGQMMKVDGSVQKSLLAMGESISINGSVGQGMTVKTKHLMIGGLAKIAGESRYESTEVAIIDPNAQIEQPLVQETPPAETRKEVKAKDRSFPVVSIIFGAIFSFILGWILLRFFPDFTGRAVGHIVSSPGRTSLLGLLVLFGGPIVFVLLAITIIGIPFAFLWICAWILVLMCSTPLCAFVIGEFISQKWWKAAKKSKLKQLAIGTIVLSVLLAIPMIGWLGKLTAGLVGSGAIVRALLNRKR
jgi:cytoskeletal protein CcmA (bactofilin family)